MYAAAGGERWGVGAVRSFLRAVLLFVWGFTGERRESLRAAVVAAGLAVVYPRGADLVLKAVAAPSLVVAAGSPR